MTNPIRIPGASNTLHPLDPITHPEHDALFVDVDGSEDAFRTFKENLSGGGTFEDRGAIAIAVGDKQYGKTALLNRCAHWLRETINSAGAGGDPPTTAKIIDLRWVHVADNQPTAERMKKVCQDLMSELQSEQCLKAKWEEHQREPNYLLHNLPRHLRPNLVIIALLPPTSDVVSELVEYARLVPKKVILLCETSFAERLTKVDAEFQSAATVPVILRLGTLRPSDGAIFYQERRRLYPQVGDIPEPTKNALSDLIKVKDMSVGEFQQILYGVYEQVQQRRPPVTKLTFKIISEHFIRGTTFGGKR
jgi:hypothetical protein